MMTAPLLCNPGDVREDHAQAIGTAVAAIYEQAELAIIATIAYLARRTATGVVLPAVASRTLAQSTAAILGRVGQKARDVIDQAAADTRDVVRDLVTEQAGREAAMRVPLADTQQVTMSLTQAAVNAADAAQGALTDTTGALPLPGDGAAGQPPGPPPLPPGGAASGPVMPEFHPYRNSRDGYRYAVEGAIRDTRGGLPANSLSLSRIQAAQKALDDLAAHGITALTDRAGRNWDLVSYVEMATRTAVSALWDDMQTQAMARSGLDLIKVYTHSTEGTCPHCLPWLGQILSLTGATPGYATFDEARATGFRHPNCRCGWFPLHAGVAAEETSPVPLDQAAAVYEASQRQRGLERRVRAAGRRWHAAITPAARARARRELAAARAASAAHRQRVGLRMTKASVSRRGHPYQAR